MLSTLRKTFSLLAAWLIPGLAMAGSVEMHNTAEHITGTWGSAASIIIVGPAAHITVDGDWFITADNIYIHPDAQIHGPGVIHLMSPAMYGASAAATTLDAGGITISCRLSLENDNTIVLAYLDPAVLYPASGFTDAHPNGSDNLVMGNSLNFGNTNAHVVLNASDLIFTSDTAATFRYQDLNTAGYAPDPAPPANAYQAYVVSNGATGGVITKLGLAANDSFNFPLGQSGPLTAPYDYTPAGITNTGSAAHDYSIRVTDYAASPPPEFSARGMDRTWQITAEDTVSALITLTHNTATGANIGTDGTSFNPAAAYITQYDSGKRWSVQHTVANGGSPVNVLTGTFTIPRSGNTSFFSKTSDTLHSLPIQLVSFDAARTDDGMAARIFWESASEGAGDYYEVLRSTDGRNFFTKVARVEAKGTAGAHAKYVVYDGQPLEGDNFYCLRTVDASGQYQLSSIRKLRFSNGYFERAIVAPNPVVPESRLIIRVRGPQQIQYSVITMSGTVVLTGSIDAAAGEARYSIGNLEQLAAGKYILRLQGTTLSESIQLVKP